MTSCAECKMYKCRCKHTNTVDQQSVSMREIYNNAKRGAVSKMKQLTGADAPTTKDIVEYLKTHHADIYEEIVKNLKDLASHSGNELHIVYE